MANEVEFRVTTEQDVERIFLDGRFTLNKRVLI